MKARAILAISAFLFANASYSQIYPGMESNHGEFDIRGTVVHQAGTRVDGLTVELAGINGDTAIARASVSSNGDFEFPNIPGGQYDLRVTDVGGGVLQQQLITVRSSFENVEVRLPQNSSEKPAAGTVSIGQLMHKVPSKALKEAQLAEKAWKKGDMQTCMDHLQKAVAIDPDYLQAQKDLGLVYSRLNRLPDMISAFEQVIKVDPHSADAYSYIAAANIDLGQYADAETAARRSLDLDPAADRTRFLLGVALVAEDKDPGEALKYLKESSSSFPTAHVFAAQILARQGERAEARTQLEEYLPVAPASKRDQVKTWLNKLETSRE